MVKVHEPMKRVAPAIAFVCGIYACPAIAIEQIGDQTIIDFDELPVGTTTITYDAGGFPFMIMGGEVIQGNQEFPAISLPNVYYSAGGMISTLGTYDAVTGWPAIGAWVTPTSAPVTATFTLVNETVTTVGFGPNQFLGVTDPHFFVDDLLAVSFSSAAPFAIDDLTYGLPTVPEGIPEPATWATMLLGWAGLAFAGYRRNTRLA